jgi:hypothetical protein
MTTLTEYLQRVGSDPDLVQELLASPNPAALMPDDISDDQRDALLTQNPMQILQALLAEASGGSPPCSEFWGWFSPIWPPPPPPH